MHTMPSCCHAGCMERKKWKKERMKDRKKMNVIVWAFPVSVISIVVPTIVSSITVETKKKKRKSKTNPDMHSCYFILPTF